jgi:hypothetical protein
MDPNSPKIDPAFRKILKSQPRLSVCARAGRKSREPPTSNEKSASRTQTDRCGIP